MIIPNCLVCNNKNIQSDWTYTNGTMTKCQLNHCNIYYDANNNIVEYGITKNDMYVNGSKLVKDTLVRFPYKIFNDHFETKNKIIIKLFFEIDASTDLDKLFNKIKTHIVFS